MLKNELIQFSQVVRHSTLKRLMVVPVGYENWKPIENTLTISEIAKHLIDCDYWLFEKIKNESLQSVVPETNSFTIHKHDEFEKLLIELNNTQKQREELISNLSQEKLFSEMYDDRFDDHVKIWWIIVRGNLDHEIHHRGQLALYLKLIEQNI